jgi:RHS repeat-associated protein
VSGSHLYFLDTDSHTTTTATIDTVTNTATRRYLDPFGNNRAPVAPAWIDIHGYLNKPIDTLTSTTHLGAREYDPTLGRFLSVDPVLDPTQPQQNNAYSYAWNNPITGTDPTGLHFVDDGSGNSAPGCGNHYSPPATSSGGGSNSSSSNWSVTNRAPAQNSWWAPKAPAQNSWLAPPNPFDRKNWTSSDTGPSAPCPTYMYVLAAVAVAPLAVAGCLTVPELCASIGIAIGDASSGGSLVTGSSLVGGAATLVTREASAAEDVAGTTARLQAHVDQAAGDYESGAIRMSARQARAVGRNPNLEQAYRGQVIDSAVKNAVRGDSDLSHLWVSRSGEFGPDFHDIGTNTWWDVTTPDQWLNHVNSYTDPFGSGIGVFTR